MRTKISIVPILAIIAALLIAGCTYKASTGPKIDSLDARVSGSTITVSVGVSGITLAAPDGETVVPGEGHIHVFLDGAGELRGAETTFTFENVAAGEHTIKAELHRGDHSLFSPSVAKEIKGTVGVGTAIIPPPPSPPPITGGVTAQAKEFTVEGSEFKFSPSIINVEKGEKVKVTFKNTGTAPHNFNIDELNVASKTISGGQTDIVEFTADKTGTFAIYCSVGNHRAQGMEGWIEI